MKMTFVGILSMLFVVSCAHKQSAEKKAEAKVGDAKTTATAAAASTATEAAKTADKAAASGATSTSLTCKHGKDVRTIKKESGEKGGCKVLYTVGGKETEIATAKNDVSYCDKVVEKTKNRLTESKFACE